MHDMRRSKGRKAFLASGGLVRASAVEDALLEHDEHRTEGFGVEDIVEGESGQVTAVADEERRIDELSFYSRVTVLYREPILMEACSTVEATR